MFAGSNRLRGINKMQFISCLPQPKVNCIVSMA